MDKERSNNTNNDTIKKKKMANSKSFNDGRKKDNMKAYNVNNISNKIAKRGNENNNSRNHKSFFDGYEKNNIRKKMINKNDNENNNTINNISQINEQKFAHSYFNTLFNNNDNKKDNEDYFSLSQNIGTKKNILRKIDTNISINNDKLKKMEINNDNDNEHNRSQSSFYMNKTKNTFYSNYLFNNDNSNNYNNESINNKSKEQDMNNYNCIQKNYNELSTIQNKTPIKLYNDNNTTINLAGSYNFHQYFNTIINNRNNSINRNNNNLNRNYNRNKPTIDNYNNKIYNNINYCQTQISNNTAENDSKNRNNFFVNEKLLEKVNDIKEEMDKNLAQNPTNSKSMKYNTLKHGFEKLLKTFKNFLINIEGNSIFYFLQKLLIGYHEVVLAFSNENRKLKELNIKLTEQYENIDKNLIECNKTLKEKQNKIELLENKLFICINNIKKINFQNSIKYKYEDKNLNNTFFEKYKNKEYNNNTDILEKDKDRNKMEQYDKIRAINEKNLDDLDALYFFDKIEMKPKRAFSSGKIIPFLPISLFKK